MERGSLQLFTALAPSATWTWRERSGAHVRPTDMDSKHLFYTLRMIWNHSMPSCMEVGRNVRRYVFGPFYTAEYMRAAVMHIGAELFSRDDVAPWMLTELDQIRAWLAGNGRAAIAAAPPQSSGPGSGRAQQPPQGGETGKTNDERKDRP